MAARDRLGGLAEARAPALFVLGAAFDVVLVETVGVGQSEAEVADLVDTLAFVTQPGAGDLLQFMKAGVLELPDVFVVNKADHGALAERTARELEAGLGLGERRAELERRRVVLVSARDGARPRRRWWTALATHRALARRARPPRRAPPARARRRVRDSLARELRPLRPRRRRRRSPPSTTACGASPTPRASRSPRVSAARSRRRRSRGARR